MFEHEGLALAYKVFGAGPRKCIALHGYGQQAQVFASLPDDTMTVIAIDLPFHGNSSDSISIDTVKKGLALDQLHSWFNAFLDSNDIESCDLIGYSMGGRFALCICEGMLHRTDTVHLIAPDGFIRNPSYLFATKTALGRAIFKRLPRYSRVIHGIAKASKGLGLLDQRVYNLVVNHTSDRSSSEQLYKTWTYLRHLQPDLERLASVLAMESKEVIVHLGEYDTIIPKAKILKWSLLRSGKAHAKIYELGHRLLVEEVLVQVRYRRGPK